MLREMKSSIRRCFLTISAIVSFSLTVCGSDTYIKREFRSAWVATVWNINWPSSTGTGSSVISSQKTQMTNYLDKLKADNFNAVFFQVRSMCDAMYKSSYEPWSSYLTGTRGKEPGWDPLSFVVTECHKRGLECHAWVNPYRWATSASGWNTTQDQQLKDDGLLLTYVATKADGSTTTTTILNPGMKAVRDRIVNVCKEIVANYDVDGIVFDDYFYPSGIPTTSNAGDYDLWKDSGSSLSFANWRRNNVNQMVADVYNMLQSTNPAVRFGISPAGVACSSSSVAATHGVDPCYAGSDWQYSSIFSDPVQWLQDGTIDYISPQIYWRTDHSTNPFGPITQWWSYVAKKFGRHHYASHSISALGSSENNNTEYWSNYAQQIQYSREYTKNAAPGAVFYSVSYLNGGNATGLGDYLLKNKFQHLSLTPAIDWKAKHSYGKVTNLRISSNTLLWDNAGYVKYAIYAIPDGVTDAKAQSSTAGGILADYLIGISYTNSYALASKYRSGYHFAVSIVDYFSNEFAPRFTTETVNYAPATTLISPNNGERLFTDFTLQWEKADAETYRLEIYSDKNLTHQVYSVSSGFSDDNTAVSYSALYEDFSNGVYYWRVITGKDACEEVSSDIFSFVINKNEIEEGYIKKRDMATYDDVNGLKLENRWERSVKENFGNISFDAAGELNKGFCVVNDTIYVCGRASNNSAAKCYIDKYDAATGAYFGRMNLSPDISGGTYPCNDIIKDDAGHILVYNYSMRMKSYPVKLYMIDKITGAASLVATCTTAKTNRADYCKVIGDVLTGNFTVYAALTQSNIVAKWNVVNGVATEDTGTTLTQFTSNAAKIGAAPRVFPVNDTEFVMNSRTTVPALYNFATGAIVSTFGNGSAAIPSLTSNIATNGFASFVCGENAFAIFPATDYDGTDGYTFNIVQTSRDLDFDNMTLLWTIPKEGLGAVNNSNNNALIDYELSGSDTAKIYLYVPGNGLASYRITGLSSTGIIPVTAPTDDIVINSHSNSITFSTTADDAWIYDISGQLVSHHRFTSCIMTSSLSRGVYIVKVRTSRTVTVRKIMIP